MSEGGGGDKGGVRVVRRAKGHGGHHGGAWKVAYADFVTAMMAFFLVMWIVGLSKPVREAIAAYFKDPIGFSKQARGGKKLFVDGGSPDGKGGKASMFVGEKLSLLDGGRGGAYTRPSTGQGAADLEQVGAAIHRELEKSPEFGLLRDTVQVETTEEGLRIELLEKTSSLFFASGSARLNRRTYRILQIVARELSKVPNPVVIEGHTDSRPLRGRGSYSNWELSADRANAARRSLEGFGLPDKRIVEVRGYADRVPRKPEDPYHYSNRRVSILVAGESPAAPSEEAEGDASGQTPEEGGSGEPAASTSAGPEGGESPEASSEKPAAETPAGHNTPAAAGSGSDGETARGEAPAAADKPASSGEAAKTSAKAPGLFARLKQRVFSLFSRHRKPAPSAGKSSSTSVQK